MVLITTGVAASKRAVPDRNGAKVICRLRYLAAPGWPVAEYIVTNNGGYRFERHDRWTTNGAPIHGLTNSGVVPVNITDRLAALANGSNRDAYVGGWSK